MQCETFEHLQVTVFISPSKRVTRTVIYRSPHTPMSKFLSEFSDNCSTVTQAQTNDKFCFMGDFNINLMSDSNNLKLFFEIMNLNYLFPVILRPSKITHKSFL